MASLSAFCHPFTFQHIYDGWFFHGQMETHRLFQILLFWWNLHKSSVHLSLFAVPLRQSIVQEEERRGLSADPTQVMRADLTKTMSNLGPGPRVKSRPTAVWGDFFIFCQHTSSETLFVSEFQKRLSCSSLKEMWKRDQDPKDKRGENGSAHPAVAGVKVQPNKT